MRSSDRLDNVTEKTGVWIKDLMTELGWEDRHQTYIAFKAVLHALRDRLTVEETAQLGAQLPMLVRGFYYEGWDPTGKPVKERHLETFLDHVGKALKDEGVRPEKVVRGVFRLLARHVSRGEIEDIKHVLPAELSALWP
jgi:uncharacterized protein (DUF2267 family)